MKNKSRKKIGRTNLTLRFAAGVYLLYCVYSLIKNIVNQSIPEAWFLSGWIAAAVFTVFAIFLLRDTRLKYYTAPLETESPPAVAEAFTFDDALVCTKDLESTLSGVTSCITAHREISKTFNEFDYAAGFSRYADACRDSLYRADRAIAEHDHSDVIIQTFCNHLIFDLKQEYDNCSSRKIKMTLMNADKKTLTFYTVPLIQELGLSVKTELSEGICNAWNNAFPPFAFHVGTYPQILGGFTGRSPMRHFRVR